MGKKRDNLLIMLKALANETRLNILKWLSNPDKYFPDRKEQNLEDIDFTGGVSVADIQKKAGPIHHVT